MATHVAGDQGAISREWYVVRLFAIQVPPLALAFETFLCKKGQSEVAKQLPSDWGYSSLENTAARPSASVD